MAATVPSINISLCQKIFFIYGGNRTIAKYIAVSKKIFNNQTRERERCVIFFTNIMTDDNDNRLLALAALELVRCHDDLRLIELNSHIHNLTFELAIVRNERDQSRVEMVRLNFIGE